MHREQCLLCATFDQDEDGCFCRANQTKSLSIGTPSLERNLPFKSAIRTSADGVIQAVAHGLHRTRKRKRLRQVNRLSL